MAAAKTYRHTTEAETSPAIQVQDRQATPGRTATRPRTAEASPIHQEVPPQEASTAARAEVEEEVVGVLPTLAAEVVAVEAAPHPVAALISNLAAGHPAIQPSHKA